MRVGSSAGRILVISPDSRTACELHYHLNVGQPRVNSACRAIVLLVSFVLDFVNLWTQGQFLVVGTNALTTTEDNDFTAFLDARCGHFWASLLLLP
jgi:hypothetical protein